MNSNVLMQIHPDEAIEILLKNGFEHVTEELSLGDGLNRVCAEDVYAKVNVPPFNRSPYDGYAFRGEDTVGASNENPVELKVIEEIPAGAWPVNEITSGNAAKILTGAPVPNGANVCIKFEKTVATETSVKIFNEIAPDTDIVYAGEDRAKGDLIISKGEVLNVGSLGELASQGHSTVKVYRRPVVGIFNMGSELTPPDMELENGKIYNSNGSSIGAFLKNIGFEVVNYGMVVDDEEAVKEKTLKVLDEVDILMTTGGASVGDYDYALSSMKDLGAEILFWKTAMKPGGSIVLSKLKDKIVFGLSGNPAAALLSLYRVGLPYLYMICGRKHIRPEGIDVFLAEDLNKKSPAVRLLRGRLEFDGGRVEFRENREQGNGVVSSFVGCDAFAEIDMGSDPLPAGTLVKAYRVSSLFGSNGE